MIDAGAPGREAVAGEARRERAIRWLRISCRTGAVADALVAALLLSPRRYAAGLGLAAVPADPGFAHALRLGAALMLGWTALLVWAERRPLERRGVLAVTIAVVLGLAANEALAVRTGFLPLAPVAAVSALQAALVALFGASLAVARPGTSARG